MKSREYLARRGPLSRGLRLLSGNRGSRWCRGRSATRATRGTLFALVHEFLLPLDIFAEAHRQIFDDHILDTQAAFQLGDQFGVGGANLLVDVNSFAVFGDAIGQLAGAPMLGLLNLGALFRASG